MSKPKFKIGSFERWIRRWATQRQPLLDTQDEDFQDFYKASVDLLGLEIRDPNTELLACTLYNMALDWGEEHTRSAKDTGYKVAHH